MSICSVETVRLFDRLKKSGKARRFVDSSTAWDLESVEAYCRDVFPSGFDDSGVDGFERVDWMVICEYFDSLASEKRRDVHTCFAVPDKLSRPRDLARSWGLSNDQVDAIQAATVSRGKRNGFLKASAPSLLDPATRIAGCFWHAWRSVCSRYYWPPETVRFFAAEKYLDTLETIAHLAGNVRREAEISRIRIAEKRRQAIVKATSEGVPAFEICD
jgi:hypothetical protein